MFRFSVALTEKAILLFLRICFPPQASLFYMYVFLFAKRIQNQNGRTGQTQHVLYMFLLAKVQNQMEELVRRNMFYICFYLLK